MVNMVHPLPTQRNASALQNLVDGTLKNVETWEALLTQAGQNARNEAEKTRLKLKAWKQLLREGKLGYFALVRNLRNIAAFNDANLVNLACTQLTNKTKIKRSLVLPFRFLTVSY